MNATEIRNALKPMADFAPAILRCAEIIEAAESAEKTIADLQKQVDAKNEEIANLEKRRADLEATVIKMRNDGMAMREKIKADEQSLRDSLRPLQEQRAQLAADLEALRAEHEGQAKQFRTELADLQKQKDTITKGIENLKKKFAA